MPPAAFIGSLSRPRMQGNGYVTGLVIKQRGGLCCPFVARVGSHPRRRRGPLSGVDLPPERRPQSAARDPKRKGKMRRVGTAREERAFAHTLRLLTHRQHQWPEDFARLPIDHATELRQSPAQQDRALRFNYPSGCPYVDDLFLVIDADKGFDRAY